ncbi:MAG: hypothetical protein R3B90_09985 [Planctomycetaceae bacterium]
MGRKTSREAIEEHLNLLSVFHYIVGGLQLLCGCFPIVHLLLGVSMVTGAFDQASPNPPPEAVGWMFIGIASTVILVSWTIGVLIIVAGRKLAARTSRTYCMVIAGLQCLFMPIGTLLGVFTLITLTKPEAIRLFDGDAAWSDQPLEEESEFADD